MIKSSINYIVAILRILFGGFIGIVLNAVAWGSGLWAESKSMDNINLSNSREIFLTWAGTYAAAFVISMSFALLSLRDDDMLFVCLF